MAALTGALGGSVVDNGLLVFDRSDSGATFSGMISGSGNVRQIGTGTLLVGGANSFTGTTTVTSGTLTLGNAAALQDSTVVLSGGGLNLNNLSATFGGLAGTGSLAMGSGSLTVGGNGNSTTYSGNLSGAASLVKTGSGLFLLTGSNTYSGLTVVDAGTLEAATTGSIPGWSNSASNPVRVAAGGMLAVGVGGSQQWTTANINALFAIPSLFGSGGTLGIDTSGGNFADGTNLAGNRLGLVKFGSNTLTLTGTNSYTGGTLVSSGALEVATTTRPCSRQGKRCQRRRIDSRRGRVPTVDNPQHQLAPDGIRRVQPRSHSRH